MARERDDGDDDLTICFGVSVRSLNWVPFSAGFWRWSSCWFKGSVLCKVTCMRGYDYLLNIEHVSGFNEGIRYQKSSGRTIHHNILYLILIPVE